VERECAHIEVGGVRLDEEAAFFVRDDGVGFDPRYAAGLFQPFQQLQPGESPGAGVGLADGPTRRGTARRQVLGRGRPRWRRHFLVHPRAADAAGRVARALRRLPRGGEGTPPV
jgi:hypothetical protein